MPIYFDNAATTPLDQAVLAAMVEVMEQTNGNPSSIHSEGRRSRTLVERARKVVANCLGASLAEIFFTSGGTESNNMILKRAVVDLGVRRIITSPTEHPCVLRSLERIKNDNSGIEVVFLQVDACGRISLHQLTDILSQMPMQKTLVSLMHANNEIGTMLDVEAVANICMEHNAFFHTDAVQTVGYFPMQLSRSNIHFLSGSAHKFHGPKGVGFVYIKQGVFLNPYIDGGSQERNMRGGTENIAGIVGLAKALELATAQMADRQKQIEEIRERLKQGIEIIFPEVTFNGDEGALQHYKILNVSFPSSPKADLLVLNLDIAGVCASGGSACSSGVEQASHVLAAIKGADDESRAVRFSFSHLNTLQEVDSTLNNIKKIFSL